MNRLEIEDHTSGQPEVFLNKERLVPDFKENNSSFFEAMTRSDSSSQFLPPVILESNGEKPSDLKGSENVARLPWERTSPNEAVGKCNDSVTWWIRQTGNPLGAIGDCTRAFDNSTNRYEAVDLWNGSYGRRVYSDIQGVYKLRAVVDDKGHSYMYKANPNQ